MVVSFGEGNAAADRMANALLALGLQRSDRVAMLCENSVEPSAAPPPDAAARCRRPTPSGFVDVVAAPERSELGAVHAAPPPNACTC